MSSKPTYLGMLNAIAVAEHRGFKLFSAWAKTTTNEPLRKVLNTVAARELEHAAAFRKRMDELGFQVRTNKSKTFKKQLQVIKSDTDDTSKFDALINTSESSEANSEDPFREIFTDKSIDPATGALLGRFIAEERLSRAELLECRQALSEGSEAQELVAIRERLERLTTTLEELKALRTT